MRLIGLAALAACASTGYPPGGPPDAEPPTVMSTRPDSGAVLSRFEGPAELVFDEIVSERPVAVPSLDRAVLLSPVHGEVEVAWRRSRITVKPREGWRPDRVYHLELLPFLVDLRQNRMRSGRLVVFSTGPAIPDGRLSGAVVDWVAGRPGAMLVEAVLLPDSLPYRALTDSAGSFTLSHLPPGEYLVWGVLDQDGNRRRSPREPFDSVRLALADSAVVTLFAFAHDTLGPRLRSAELLDSLTVRLRFDRALDPTRRIGPEAVTVSPLADTRGTVAALAVLTARELEALRARAAADTQRTAAPRDTVAPGPGGAPAPTPTPDRPSGPPAAARPESTLAQRMLARRPPPSDERFLRLGEPLSPGTRYRITLTRLFSLSGVSADAVGQLLVPAPRRARTAAPGAGPPPPPPPPPPPRLRRRRGARARGPRRERSPSPAAVG